MSAASERPATRAGIEVKSPAMTGQWEARLRQIERGAAELAPFLEGIQNYVREVVGNVRGQALDTARRP